MPDADSCLAPLPFGIVCVVGSAAERLIRLMESMGYVLVGADDVDHLSRIVLHFDSEAGHMTTLTLEDTL